MTGAHHLRLKKKKKKDVCETDSCYFKSHQLALFQSVMLTIFHCYKVKLGFHRHEDSRHGNDVISLH